MYAVIAAQVAFCFVVLFLAGLFIATFRSLSSQHLGFDPKNLLLIETYTPHGQPPESWSQMADTLRAVPGSDGCRHRGLAAPLRRLDRLHLR
jgi:putative ABC transport system permease protein